MKNKKGFALSFLLVLFIFGVTIPLFMTTHRKVKAQAITDLTNTTWTFNDTVLLPGSIFGSYKINYVVIASSSEPLLVPSGDTFKISSGVIEYGSDDGFITDLHIVYNDDRGWIDSSYKTITINGGLDATNSTFISWLQANATPPTPPTPPTPTTTQITHKYWSPYGAIRMQDDEIIGDNDIEYTILYNEYTNTIYETPSTGLVFYGIDTDSGDEHYSAIISYTGGGINILYARDNSNDILNAMWLEFTYGDYMDTQLYDFLDTWGLWFDDAEADAYLVGMNQGYAEGTIYGRALGQADGTQYTGLITGIFNGLGGLLSIQVFPNITIGLLIGLPLLLGALIIILKILRG